MLLVNPPTLTSCPSQAALCSMADLCQDAALGRAINPADYDIVAALEIQEFLAQALQAIAHHRPHHRDYSDEQLALACQVLETMAGRRLTNRRITTILRELETTFSRVRPRWQPNANGDRIALLHLIEFLSELQEAIEKWTPETHS